MTLALPSPGPRAVSRSHWQSWKTPAWRAREARRGRERAKRRQEERLRTNKTHVWKSDKPTLGKPVPCHVLTV